MFTTSMTLGDILLNFAIAIAAGYLVVKFPRFWSFATDLWAERSISAATRKLKVYERELAAYKALLENQTAFLSQTSYLHGKMLLHTIQGMGFAVMAIALLAIQILSVVDPTG